MTLRSLGPHYSSSWSLSPELELPSEHIGLSQVSPADRNLHHHAAYAQ